jgi:hypothetical protein
VTREETTEPASETLGGGSLDRRAALKALVGIGLATGLTDCTSSVQPSAPPPPAERQPEAAATQVEAAGEPSSWAFFD